MELTKQLLPLALTVFLAGCNPTETTGDDDEKDGDATPSKLSLAKSFVQDFAGLQTSLTQLKSPAQAFAAQVETDLASAEQSDAEALGRAFEAIASQLNVHWDAMVQPNGKGGQEIVFQDVPVTAFEDDAGAGVTFGNGSTYSFSDSGRTLASGSATVDMGGFEETVSFDLTLELPAYNDSDTGNISYTLNASIRFTTDSLLLAATNVSATLDLELGSGTMGEFDDNDMAGAQLNALSLGLETITLQIGGLSFTGGATLAVANLSLSELVIESPSGFDFNITGQGRLTSSNESYLDSSMSLSMEYSDTHSTTAEKTDLYVTSGTVTYRFATRLVSGGHDFDIEANGVLAADDVLEEDYSANSWSGQVDLNVDGALTITHNDAKFIMDYNLGYNESESENSYSNQYDLILQDGTVATDIVLIVLGNFDDAQTAEVEFGIIKVSGAQYGTLYNDQGVTRARFTDNSSVVVFDGY